VAATRRHGIRPIHGALAAACALAGIASGTAEATDLDTGLLYYAESQRVTAIESVVNARHDFGGDRIGEFKFVYDALTGATPNGAVPSPFAQTFTGASGRHNLTISPGLTPLDDGFTDHRFALSGSLAFPLDRLTKATTGLYGSTESDYNSVSANVSLARDLSQRNTTVSVSGSYSSDTVSPHGGPPVPLGPVSTVLTPGHDDHGGEGEDGGDVHIGVPKHVADLMAGLTQVIDRATLFQFNWSLSRVSGYQNDPYKLISVVSAQTGAPTGYLYEGRPDLRLKHVLFARLKRDFTPAGIADLSYRFMKDDWGIVSHTFELRYRQPLAPEHYLEPHVRFYRQTAADFYRHYLLQGDPLPSFVTADNRLGAFSAWTLGLEYGLPVSEGKSLSVRLEYYWQFGDHHPAGAPGYLAGADLFPTVSAWIVQVGYALGI
jgi:hypothetical protein